MQRTSLPGRIEALDYLRGFFILVIIVDHLWRWPNLFQYVSGRGELWASAAEGFVIISGLLVGYVRGRKGLKKAFGEISRKLMLRSLMLYAWAIISTVVLVAASWYLTFRSNIAHVPYDRFDWTGVLTDAVRLDYTHMLTHFLYLYAIFLFVSPAVIWLLRKRLWWVGGIASTALWWVGIVSNVEWMQWQILFFIPAIAGFYLDQLIAYFRNVPKLWLYAFISGGLASIALSATIILPNDPGSYRLDVFTREPLTLGRVGMAFVWFVTLAWLFNRALPVLSKSIGWILMPLGTHSLTAYIVHSFVLTALAFFVVRTETLWLNTIIAVAAILGTWAIIRIPGINRVIPR